MPAAAIYLAGKVKILGVLGEVFICYAGGFLLSFVLGSDASGFAMSLSEILVPIAIPLILFSADLKMLRRLAKPALISFCLVCVSVLAVSTAAFFIMNDTPDASKFSGMLVGVYTGGTPNLLAIGKALGLENDKIVLANMADMIVGGVYFILLLSVVPKIAGKLLRPFSGDKDDVSADTDEISGRFGSLKMLSGKRILSLLPVLLLAVGCLGISAAAALLITGELNVVIIMLGVTTLGAACTFIRSVREHPDTFTCGQYLIYMFSFALGLSFDISAFASSGLKMLVYFVFVQFGTIILHFILCKAAGTDRDTAVITSTAGIFGPAFIVPVADALKNKKIVLPGLICGILGYLIGNYLGIGLGLLLNTF